MEFSREAKTIDKLGHDYETKWTTDIEPTCTTVGSKSHHCTRCGDKADVTEVPANGHSYLTDFVFDEANHWKECACGEKTEVSQHTWNDGEITKEATVDEEGVKTYTCIVCGHTKDESIAKLPMQTDTPPATDNHDENEGLSGGAIAGIVTGSTVVAGTGGFSLFWFVIKKKSWAELVSASKSTWSSFLSLFKKG